MKKQLQNILTFVIIFLIVNLVFNFFFKPNPQEETPSTVTVTPTHTDFELGTAVTVDVKNNTQSHVTIKNTCPNEPLNVLEKQNNQWIQKHKEAQISCAGAADIILNPGDKHTITFANWNHSLFNEEGTYKVQAVFWTAEQPAASTQQTGTEQTATQQNAQAAAVAVETQQSAVSTTTPDTSAPALNSKIVESSEFQIKPQGWLGWFWTTVFYQPIYNLLILVMSFIPGNGLGFAIIILTLLIRTVLLIPNQKALESQRRMQEVQPKLNHIKEKYKDNQEMIGKETMAVMQQHKVNPLGSCLPLLIQFPILIALYYAVQNGLNPDNSYLLYGGMQNFDYSKINVIFLGILDLTKVNSYILPIFVGGLQFLQMKLAIVRNKKKDANKELSNDNKPVKKNEMDTANNMMLYFMPAMIAIFTASAPAGVGLYWSTSTLYGIAQQMVVNKKAEKEKVKVHVIETPKN